MASKGTFSVLFSILGERYTHGHHRRLLPTVTEDSRTLYVLGNGKQRKSYLYVQDCLAAMMLAIEKAQEKVNISTWERTSIAK